MEMEEDGKHGVLIHVAGEVGEKTINAHEISLVGGTRLAARRQDL
jgi:hypothetical protein